VHPQSIDHMSALGEEFRSAREARGVTLSGVAEQIHIRSVYLNAIENEDWSSIGAPVYVRGFIRTYARFLGLDAEAAVARFNLTVPAERPSASLASSALEEDAAPGPSLWAIVGIVLAVALVGFVGWEYWQYTHGGGAPVAVVTPTPQPAASQPAAAPATPSVPGSAAPGTSPSAVASPAPGQPHRLEIRLTQRSWLRVAIDGNTLLEGIFPAGTTRTFTGKIADVRAGNAGGVTVGLNGRPPAPMGKEGDVVEQRYSL
jgi:cytoskeletal protein RodZ